MTELKAKPKRSDFYHDLRGDHAFLLRERDYYRDALAVAVEALEKIGKSIPAYGQGYFCHVHFDHEGNELGEEHIDPVSVVQQLDNISSQALSTIKGSQS